MSNLLILLSGLTDGFNANIDAGASSDSLDALLTASVFTTEEEYAARITALSVPPPVTILEVRPAVGNWSATYVPSDARDVSFSFLLNRFGERICEIRPRDERLGYTAYELVDGRWEFRAFGGERLLDHSHEQIAEWARLAGW